MITRLALALMASVGVVVSAQQAPPSQEQTYRPGPDIENPMPLRSVQPKYPRDAMAARLQGVVELEVVILPNGTVGDVRVIKSLDKQLGLDQEAVSAAKQWLFRPGTLKSTGRPVPVIVTIVLEFRLHSPPPPPNQQGIAPANIVAGDEFYRDAYPLIYPLLVQPTVKRMVHPRYTSDAMRAKLQGTVEVEAVIRPDGTIDRTRVVKSLDTQLGLDANAIDAVKQWVFEPGTLQGQPVPVVVQLTLEFRIH
jgi:TonB family protein